MHDPVTHGLEPGEGSDIRLDRLEVALTAPSLDVRARLSAPVLHNRQLQAARPCVDDEDLHELMPPGRGAREGRCALSGRWHPTTASLGSRACPPRGCGRTAGAR